MSKEYKIPEENIDDITLLEPEATYSYADYLRWSLEGLQIPVEDIFED